MQRQRRHRDCSATQSGDLTNCVERILPPVVLPVSIENEPVEVIDGKVRDKLVECLHAPRIPLVCVTDKCQ